MNRVEIEDVLFKIGIPPAAKGFDYITDAIEYMSQNGERASMTKEIYPHVAKKRHTSMANVERAIRHGFKSARKSERDPEMIERYIGLETDTNANSLSKLYRRMERERETKKQEKVIFERLESEIRAICREEVAAMLGELGKIQAGGRDD